MSISRNVKAENVTDTAKAIRPPRSWSRPDLHFRAAVEDPWYHLVFKLLSDLVYETNDFFRLEGLAPALMPITCGSISSPMGLGSDSLPVQVNLFGRSTYLADSMQFQLEYMLRHAMKGTFYIMPTFRGEEPDARHLNQFFHAEAEIRGDLDNVMGLVGRYIQHLTKRLLDVHGDTLIQAGIGTQHMEQMLRLRGQIPKLSFVDAKRILSKEKDSLETLTGGVETISRHGEALLMRELGGILWLTHLPSAVVPFYQANAEDGTSALCADLLLGIGEVVGCGQRHDTYHATLAALAAHNVKPDEYAWYLEMKRLYPMRTSGFGMGIERFLLWVLRHNDIRDIAIMSRLKGITCAP